DTQLRDKVTTPVFPFDVPRLIRTTVDRKIALAVSVVVSRHRDIGRVSPNNWRHIGSPSGGARVPSARGWPPHRNVSLLVAIVIPRHGNIRRNTELGYLVISTARGTHVPSS